MLLRILAIIKEIWWWSMQKAQEQDGWIGAAIAAGAAIYGQQQANEQNADSTARANASNAEMAANANMYSLQQSREQQKFQERMSSTAYQRATQDMRKAGINPMLAYSQGGASSPGGASAQFHQGKAEAAHAENVLGPAVSTAIDYKNKSETIGLGKEGLAIQLGQQKINQANATADIALKGAQAAATASTAKRTELESQALQMRAKKEKLEGDWYSSDTGQTLHRLNKINESVGGALDSANSARDLLNPLKFLNIQHKRTNNPRHRIDRDGTRFDLNTGEVIP